MLEIARVPELAPGTNFSMYRVFIVKRRGGQFQLEVSQNVLGTIRTMNKRLEKLGKKKWDLWKLVWFSKPDQLYPAQKLMTKMLRCGGWTAMQKLVEEYSDTAAGGLEIEVVPEF